VKKWISFFLVLILLAAMLFLSVTATPQQEWTFYEDRMASPATLPETNPEPSLPPETNPSTEPAVTETHAGEETLPPDVLTFTEKEEELLLKLGMSERGSTGCITCMALVMRTALNRVESPRFSSTLKGVIYAQDQFTPVMDGSFDKAVPNDACYAALDLVIRGWDESQGALFYEFCEGESWHSKNLKLLTEHCNTRFYE
jgi:N-acetylmuramoyl-L-alanine amidase